MSLSQKHNSAAGLFSRLNVLAYGAMILHFLIVFHTSTFRANTPDRKSIWTPIRNVFLRRYFCKAFMLTAFLLLIV